MLIKYLLDIEQKRQYLNNEFSKYKRRAKKLMDEGYYLNALKMLQYAASIAYDFPILASYVDDEMEEYIGMAGYEIIQSMPVIFDSNPKNIILYSTTAVDYGALTEQYLYGLKSLGFNVLLIVSSDNGTKSAARIKKYCEHNDVEVFFPDSVKFELWTKGVRDKIQLFKPSKIFIHSNPIDIRACIAFLEIDVDTYFINHSDHSFWLGKNFFKYFIEHRNFGIALTNERRQISKDRIFKVPFYHIVNEDETFKGLDINIEDKLVLISGGALYKYYLEPELPLFNHIKDLLLKYENIVFLLCGAGDEKPVKKFIKQNSLQDQFFYLGKRGDFSLLISKADILVESYPYRGGLVTLYAINENIPVLGVSDNETPAGSLNDWYGMKGYEQPKNFKEFINEAELLIESENYRNKVAKAQKADMWCEREFLRGLDDTLNLIRNNSVDEEFSLTLNDDRTLSFYLSINPIGFRLWFNKVLYLGNSDGYIKGILQLLKAPLYIRKLTTRSFGGLIRNYFK